MPVCFLMSEIAVECDAKGDQISSDISVCGIFTTDKLANEAVLTWHERDYVPVAAGDFDSYRLSKPEGLLHLVACAGQKSWEVSIELIVMNTEFTMSLLDPSIPEEEEEEDQTVVAVTAPSPPVKTESVRPATVKKRKIKTEPKDVELTRSGKGTPTSLKKTPTATPKRSHHKKKSSIVVLKCASATANNSHKQNSNQSTPSTTTTITTTSPAIKEHAVAAETSRERMTPRETKVTPTKSYFDKILLPSDRPSEASWNNMEEKRKKKVEKELKQLQGWTSD